MKVNKKPEDKVSQYPYSIETRTALLEQSMMNIDRTLIEIKSDIKSSIVEIKSDIKESRKEMRSEFRWLLTFTIGGFVGLFGFMAHGFHWF